MNLKLNFKKNISKMIIKVWSADDVNLYGYTWTVQHEQFTEPSIEAWALADIAHLHLNSVSHLFK